MSAPQPEHGTVHPLYPVPDDATAPPPWPDEPPPARPRSRWTDAELMATEFPEPRWAVPGLISEGLNLLVGAPKLGKSWLSLGLAADIANGEPVLGRVGADPGPVLYLALEDTGKRLQKRRAIQLAAGSQPSRDLTLDTWCPPITAGGDACIAEWLEDNPNARLVIIDTFEKVRGRTNTGSAYGDDYTAAGRIKRIADHYGVPILLVHHVRKDRSAADFLDLVSGTNGIAGAADTILVLERPRGQADGVLHVTGRDVDEADHALSFNPSAGAWTLLDGPASDYTLHDTRATILRHLRDNPGHGPTAISRATGVELSLVKQTCRRMAEDGQLHTTAGRYRPADGDNSDGPRLSPQSPCHQTTHDQHE